MGRLGHTLSTLRPVGHPARTQDSLPAVGQTLPGGLSVPLGSSERFLRCFLHRFPPFPGFPWRKRAPVRNIDRRIEPSSPAPSRSLALFLLVVFYPGLPPSPHGRPSSWALSPSQGRAASPWLFRSARPGEPPRAGN